MNPRRFPPKFLAPAAGLPALRFNARARQTAATPSGAAEAGARVERPVGLAKLRAAPTIVGVVAGRDEILEAAVKYLRENVKK